ncbi:MAG: cyclic nucleotide-binding domain-containing protein [Desulfobacterales bacterium]
MGNDFGLFGKIYEKGELICRQDDPGDEMYIIQSGAVEVSSRRAGHKVVLTILEKEDFFGEMALLDRNPRSATVTSITRSRLLSLSRRVFMEKVAYSPDIVLYVLKALTRRIDRMTGQIRAMIDGDAKLRRLLVTGNRTGGNPEHFCDHERGGDRHEAEKPSVTPPLEDMKPSLAEPFASALKFASEPPTEVEPGRVLFEQGDDGSRMYFIEQGTVEIYHATCNGDLCLAVLGAGDFFGEMSLITGQPRTASAKARSPVRLRSISREDMLSGIRSDPETGLMFLRILIDRLRVITRALEEPQRSLKTLRQAILPKFKATEKISIGFSSLSSCGGCTAMLVRSPDELSRITDKVRVRYCPMLMDQEQILETDIAVVDGAVRMREDEEKLNEVRRKSRFLVAWGTCAAFGGLPALANAFELEELIEETYGQTIDPFSYYLKGKIPEVGRQDFGIEEHLLRKVRKLSDVVKVDFYLPGCPPMTHLLENLLLELKGEQLFEGNRQIVCSECPRKFKKAPTAPIGVFPSETGFESTCMLSLGTLCMGFLTRGGCKAACTAGGLPCWGCRGPSDSVIKKISAGESVEEVMLHNLARRLKTSESEIKSPLHTLHLKSVSALGFSEHFIKDVARIR